MTPAEQHLPWRAFAIDGLAPWTAVVSGPAGDMELRAWSEPMRTPRGVVETDRHELLDTCAAVELGRLDVTRLVAAYRRARERDRAMPWLALLAGADGYRREDAPGLISVADALTRVGLSLARVEIGPRSSGTAPRRRQAPNHVAQEVRSAEG